MMILKQIGDNANQVLPHQLLMFWLKEYQRPNDKINHLKAQGYLESIKKGLYFAGPQLTDIKPDRMLVANHILGPSYVSLESALSFYGFIPERVYEVSSMTTKAPRSFDTKLGRFTYYRLPLPYYSFGLRMIHLPSEQHAVIASPEKALCDKIISTAGILFRSTKNAYGFFVESMRIDEAALKGLDTEMMKKWLSDSPKRESLLMTIKMIEQL